MKLKIETYMAHHVGYNDLDEFLTKRFEFEERYEFIEAETMSNDSAKTIHICKEELSKWDKKELEETLKTKKWECGITHILLQHLCNLGEIPEGEYVIEVSW